MGMRSVLSDSGGRVRANTKFLYSRAKYASVLWFSVPVVSWVHRYTGRKTGVALGFLVHSSFLPLQRCRRSSGQLATTWLVVGVEFLLACGWLQLVSCQVSSSKLQP